MKLHKDILFLGSDKESATFQDQNVNELAEKRYGKTYKSEKLNNLKFKGETK